MIVFVDSSILGMLCNPNSSPEVNECKQWLYSLLARSARVVTSDICDYEIRRSLILALTKNSQINGLENLNDLTNIIEFIEITKNVLYRASEIWSQAQLQGKPTADRKALDIDLIISAHCQLLQEEHPGRYVIIATKNIKHLSRFAEAKNWKTIKV
ncbi:PIN domain-containing protein [Spirulina sp. 06S082]|uniref:PIN domain-containing protein n=1 Tax=Spirulina sp. 06S082 TaxID=3110248 RepID=UPI002B21B052|nr:PIN domain-containing protein [Spirulina sp. 06S082]MEA5468415.1 PIN domain-containing protein [Spirulina sp. 06S082]